MKMFLSLSAVVCFAFTGCAKSDSGSAGKVKVDEAATSEADDHAGHDHAQHAHAEHGPHGGDIIELGREEFHAELAHGDDGISIYVLDSSATKPVAISSEKLVLSLKHDGTVKSFDLTSNPGNSDKAGSASRFTSADPMLDEWLDGGAEGAVVIEINGKSYTGKVAHNHDHEGHDH